MFSAHAGATVNEMPAATTDKCLRRTALDYKAQEDARRFEWMGAAASLSTASASPLDLDRQSNGDVMQVATLRLDASSTGPVWIGMRCSHDCKGRVDVSHALKPAHWERIGIPLKCLQASGANMRHIMEPFVIDPGKGVRLDVSNVMLGMNPDQVIGCAK